MKAVQQGGVLGVVGQVHKVSGRPRQLDIAVLAVADEQFEGLLRTDMQGAHQDAFGLLYGAAAGVGRRHGRPGNQFRLALQGPREVNDEGINVAGPAALVQHALPRGQDPVFPQAGVDEPVDVKNLPPALLTR